MNFADMIFHHALSQPEKPAIILSDRVVTYAMVARGAMSVGDRIAALKLPPHALVAVAIELAAAPHDRRHGIIPARLSQPVGVGLARNPGHRLADRHHP